MRIIYMGSPDFAIPALKSIIDNGHDVVGVYSQPARPAKRGHNITRSAVESFAKENGLLCFTPQSLKDDKEFENFANLNPDIGVVCAYGLILPERFLKVPKFGFINIHGSLLPRWRGAAPIQRAIMQGDTKTGITIMYMDVGLDTGDIATMEEVEINDGTTFRELQYDMANLGAKMVVEAIEMMSKDNLPRLKQPEFGITYAEKISKSEAKIDWNKTGRMLIRQINVLPSFFSYKNEQIKLLKAEFVEDKSDNVVGTIISINGELLVKIADGALSLKELQRPSRKSVKVKDFLNGFNINIGDVLS